MDGAARDGAAKVSGDVMAKLDGVAAKVDALAAQLHAMAAKLNDVVAQLNDVVAAHASTTEGVSRMTGHIDFVEGVYDTLRHPLSRLTGLVRRQELPAPPGSHPQSAQ